MIYPKEFRKACYEAARRTRGQVTGFVPCEQCRDFETGEIAYPHGTAAVLWTQSWLKEDRREILGIAEAPVTYGPITFIDEPGLLAVLRELLPEFRLYTRAELEAPINPMAPPWVSYREARSWRPDKLGLALFNFWD